MQDYLQQLVRTISLQPKYTEVLKGKQEFFFFFLGNPFSKSDLNCFGGKNVLDNLSKFLLFHSIDGKK